MQNGSYFPKGKIKIRSWLYCYEQTFSKEMRRSVIFVESAAGLSWAGKESSHCITQVENLHLQFFNCMSIHYVIRRLAVQAEALACRSAT
jgi:hypothetical protein